VSSRAGVHVWVADTLSTRSDRRSGLVGSVTGSRMGPPDPESAGSEPQVPGQAAVVAQPPPTTVGITIENLAVFDPAIPHHRRFPYNWLPLHNGTRRSTIRQKLLFREGDPF
jgi:hypothetical protein